LTHETLENLSHENRKFPPSDEFAAQANGKADLYDAAAADHEGFWADQARSYLTWTKDFEQTLDWSDAPFAKWFVGGELNASYNCVDRHVEAGRGDKVAIHFVGEQGDTRDITYSDLFAEVQKAANSPARGSAHRTRLSSVASPRTPCAPGSAMPRPRSW